MDKFNKAFGCTYKLLIGVAFLGSQNVIPKFVLSKLKTCYICYNKTLVSISKSDYTILLHIEQQVDCEDTVYT